MSDRLLEAMSFAENLALVLDKDNLPLKKRDQRLDTKLQLHQQQECDAVHFKVPYPHRSHAEFKVKHPGPFRPIPRRISALHQPWMQTNVPINPKQLIPSVPKEHHGWAEWREFNALPPGWDLSHHNQSQEQLSLHHSPLHYIPRLSPLPRVGQSFQLAGRSSRMFKFLEEKHLNTHKWDGEKYNVSKEDRKIGFARKGEKVNSSLMERSSKNFLHEDFQHSSIFEPAKASPWSSKSLSNISPGKMSRSYISLAESRPADTPFPECFSTSSSAANQFPWLLPHFMAGSLIELGDGQLRKVEHLQTEDFLLGSLACPDLRLSCCTVQSIIPLAASPSVSRLLILLHEQQSQELVDVHVEYPFYVRGRGWSSCCPGRTARLCGLLCRQLSVGDICLALTPVSLPVPASADPHVLSRKGGHEPLETQTIQQLKQPTGDPMRGPGAGRRRHCSAP